MINAEVVENEKLSDVHKTVYNKYNNQMGKRMCSDFYNFLNNFTLSPSDPNYEAYADQMNAEENQQIHYYRLQVQHLRNDEMKTMLVDWEHLTSFNWDDPLFLDRLLQEYGRFEPYLKKALTMFLADQDMLITATSWYQIGIYNLPSINQIRDLKTAQLGRIMSIQGTVTRTTEVKPELMLGAFRCKQCHCLINAVEQDFKYTQPVKCDIENCLSTEFNLENKNSVFMDWQKVRLQELSSDIPAGSMPRSIDVILRGDIVDKAKPGDRTVFTGTLVVVPDVVQLMKPGEKQQSSTFDGSRMQRNDNNSAAMDGFGGLSKTGVKDLSFKMVFIASAVFSQDTRFGFSSVKAADDEF